MYRKNADVRKGGHLGSVTGIEGLLLGREENFYIPIYRMKSKSHVGEANYFCKSNLLSNFLIWFRIKAEKNKLVERVRRFFSKSNMPKKVETR